MIKSESHKFIFFENPRTGTASIDRVLYKHGKNIKGIPKWRRHFKNFVRPSKHVSPYEATQICDIENYFKFVFVRNPFGRMVSMYKYHNGLCVVDDKKKYQASSFLDYLRVSEETGSLYSQLSWVSDPGGAILVDFIGRFESLQEDFNLVCSRIGLPELLLERTNISKGEVDYTKFYDTESFQIVSKNFYEDLVYFGYSFENV